MYFIDYKKPFDNVEHDHLSHILTKYCVNGQNVRIISNLCRYTRARTLGGEIEFDINKKYD